VSDRGEGGRPPQERDEEKERLRERIAVLEAQIREKEQAMQVRELYEQTGKKRTKDERTF